MLRGGEADRGVRAGREEEGGCGGAVCGGCGVERGVRILAGTRLSLHGGALGDGAAAVGAGGGLFRLGLLSEGVSLWVGTGTEKTRRRERMSAPRVPLERMHNARGER